jgi:hypothetical protein
MLDMATAVCKTCMPVREEPTLYKDVTKRHLLHCNSVLTNTTLLVLGPFKTDTVLFAFVSLI